MPAEYRPMALLLALVVWVCGSAIAIASDDVCAEDAAGTVVAVMGRVELPPTGSNNWRPVTPGTAICNGTSVRTGPDGMTAIWLYREHTMARLTASSTISYAAESTFRPLLEIWNGAAYLFSRTPLKLDVKTPHVSGGIEGTEFLLHVDESGDRSFIQVFEGTVSAKNNLSEAKLYVAQGETLTATDGEAPRKLSPTDNADVQLWRGLVDPLDAVQWTLYYPVISDQNSPLGASLAAGDLKQARSIIGEQPKSDETIASQIIIDTVQARSNQDRTAVLQSAQEASAKFPQSELVALALSYAQQANSDVENARIQLDAFALADTPSSPLLSLRRAELAFINGDKKSAKTLGQAALDDPLTAARAATVLGFVALSELSLKEAEDLFKTAIEMSSHDPAPRFGLGLAKIRRGDEDSGRQEIEFATVFDPNVSLYRSYLGRAYFEEGRSEKALSQYDLAKERDPQDPTPWFFEANQLFLENQPIIAFWGLNESLRLNDNRSVYRTDKALAGDFAVRGSVLSGIYRTLRLEEFGIPEASRAIGLAPSNHAGHRFLADLFADQPFQDFARASEIFKAQILQPITLDPVRPQLAETDLTFLGGAGFNGISFNEYTTAFETNGHRLTLAALGGNFGTAANEFILSGVQGKFGYSLSQFHYETDGVRDNNDVRHDILSAFVQGEVTPKIRLQAEFRYRNTEQGDVTQNFDPTNFSTVDRSNIESFSGRVGGRVDLNRSNTVIANFGYRDFSVDVNAETSSVSADVETNTDGFSTQVQHIYSGQLLSTVAGVDYQEDDLRLDSRVDISNTFGGICPPILGDCVTESLAIIDRRAVSAYGYVYFTPSTSTQITLGFSHDDLNEQVNSFDEVQPKIGFSHRVFDHLTLRFAYTQASGTDPDTPLTLQPTQIAGFAQFFDDSIGSTNEQVAGAIDYIGNDFILAQFSASHRKTTFSISDLANSFALESTSKLLNVGGLITVFPKNNVKISVSSDYKRLKNGGLLIGPDTPNLPLELETLVLPISASYFSSFGTSFEVRGTYVRQELQLSPLSTISDNTEDFFTLDLEVTHRFRAGRGEISIGVKNLLGADFRYQDLNSLLNDTSNPEFTDETLLSVSGTIRF